MPWGNTGDHRDFEPQRHDDGCIEVIGFTMASLVRETGKLVRGARLRTRVTPPLVRQAALQVGGHGERLHQCREVVLTTFKTVPVQVRTGAQLEHGLGSSKKEICSLTTPMNPWFDL